MEARTLTPAELLHVWEKGSEDGPVERAVTLLAAVYDVPYTEVLRWPVGVRDARLLSFRAERFGPTLEFISECPACEASVEADLPIGELLAGQEDVAVLHEATLDDGGVVVRFRPATSEDVLYALSAGGTHALLERCLDSVDGEVAGSRVEALLMEALADADPLADLRIDLVCPDCGERWNGTLDPPGFVWSEIDAWARRLLREVHVIASAYGWSEADIIALGAARRAAYLEMLS